MMGSLTLAVATPTIASGSPLNVSLKKTREEYVNQGMDITTNVLKFGLAAGDAIPVAGGFVKAACGNLINVLEGIRVRYSHSDNCLC